MSDEPTPPFEFVHCVLLGIADENERGEKNPEARTSWCGRKIEFYEWAFCDSTHALLTVRGGSRLLFCRACAKSIVEVIDRNERELRNEEKERRQ